MYARQSRSPCPFAGKRDKRSLMRKLLVVYTAALGAKSHARCDNQGRTLGFVLTGGQVFSAKDS